MAWKKDTSLHCTGMKTNVERLLYFGCEWSIVRNYIATVTIIKQIQMSRLVRTKVTFKVLNKGYKPFQ